MATSFAERLAYARGGDQAAIEDLLARWRPLLRLQARMVLKSELASLVDSSDIVQETLTQAFRDLNQFRGQTEAEWVGWLRIIAVGQAMKAMRHHRADKRDHARELSLSEIIAAVPTVTPLDMLIEQERAAQLAGAIEALPEPMREVVLRRVFDQQPFDEIARSLGRTAGAVRVLWTRAIRRLRELLGTNS